MQSTVVVPGLVPGIHVLEPALPSPRKAWMAGPTPAKTIKASVAVNLHNRISFPGQPRAEAHGRKGIERLPPVRARGRLWTPAFAGATIAYSDSSLDVQTRRVTQRE